MNVPIYLTVFNKSCIMEETKRKEIPPMKSPTETHCSFEKKHLYANQYAMLTKSGLYFQLTMGRPLSKSYHDHDFYEIMCVLSGSCTHCINDEKWHFDIGKLAFICPGSYHLLYDQSENTNILALSVKPTMMNLFLDAYGVPANNEVVMLDAEIIRQIRQSCVEISIASAGDKSKLIRILLGQLLSYLLSKGIKQKREMPQSFEMLLSRVNTLETVSEGIPAFLRLSNFSYPHLCRLTKRYLDMTPGEYITKLRLQYAYEMIAWSSDRYEDICDKVGFSSMSHFTKLIHQHYGMTPARIRRQNMDSTPTV